MKRAKVGRPGLALLSLMALFLVTLPTLAAAQGSAPASPPPATPDIAKQAQTATQAVNKLATVPDSARSALRAQIAKELKQMADTLQLTPEQREKARPILLDQASKVRQLRDKYAPMPRTPENRAAMQKEMQTLRDASDTNLGAVLTADQMTRYKAWRDARLAAVRSRMGMPEATKPK